VSWPIPSISTVTESPGLSQRGGFRAIPTPWGVPVKMTVTPGGVHRRAPLLGEDTRTRLSEAGLSEIEIDELLEKRAAFAAK